MTEDIVFDILRNFFASYNILWDIFLREIKIETSCVYFIYVEI